MHSGTARIAADALVAWCAISGLKQPSLVPIWRHEAIRLQPVRVGSPCFGAALAGYVKVMIADDKKAAGVRRRRCPVTRPTRSPCR